MTTRLLYGSILCATIAVLLFCALVSDVGAHRQQLESGLSIVLSGGQIRSGTGMATPNDTTPDEAPCDLRENACMDWCGTTVRRPGYCPNGQMCCLLIY